MRSDVNMARDYAGGGAGIGGVRNVAAAFAEYSQLFALGVDGMFSDFPNDEYDARAMYAADQTYVIEYAFATANGSRYLRTGARDASVIALANLKSTPMTRTTDIFKAWSTNAQGTRPVCRYFDAANVRHLYSIDSNQCAAYGAAGFADEGVAYYASVIAGSCATDTNPVSRYVRTVGSVVFERYSAATDPKFTDFTKVAAPVFCVPK